MPISGKTLAAAIMLPILLSGCVAYPTSSSYQDPVCDVRRNRFGIEVKSMDISGCRLWGEASEGCLGGMLLMGPVTLGVSGTIVVVGDFGLALEREADNYRRKWAGKCRKTPATPQAAPSAPGPHAAITGDPQHRR